MWYVVIEEVADLRLRLPEWLSDNQRKFCSNIFRDQDVVSLDECEIFIGFRMLHC